MRRYVTTLAAAIVLALTLSFGLTACGSSTQTTQSVCVNKITKKRVDDNRCPRTDNSNLLYTWWYLNPGERVPAVGSRAKQGTSKRPSTGKIRMGGQSRTGGVLKKQSSGSLLKGNSGSKSGGSKSGSSSRSGGSSGGSRGR